MSPLRGGLQWTFMQLSCVVKIVKPMFHSFVTLFCYHLSLSVTALLKAPTDTEIL